MPPFKKKKNETETAIKWLLMTLIIVIEWGLAQPSSSKVSLAENGNIQISTDKEAERL